MGDRGGGCKGCHCGGCYCRWECVGSVTALSRPPPDAAEGESVPAWNRLSCNTQHSAGTVRVYALRMTCLVAPPRNIQVPLREVQGSATRALARITALRSHWKPTPGTLATS